MKHRGADEETSEQVQAHPSDRFASTLRAAILARGLSLARVQDRLTACGTPVSIATLSHWQSGRSQPERVSSFHALAHLERILGLPAGRLTSLVDPPRPRGRRTGGEPLSFEEVFHREARATAALLRFDQTSERDLAHLSFHDRVEVGPDGRVRRVWSRRVLRATADGPDRIVVLYSCDGAAAPRVWPVRGCTVGKTFADPELPGVAIAELMMGRRLRQGEPVILEYEVEFGAPYPDDVRWEKRFDRPAREYVLEVAFTAPRVPTRCVEYRAPRVETDDFVEHEVTVDCYGRASAVALDLGPGAFGMRWEWPDR